LRPFPGHLPRPILLAVQSILLELAVQVLGAALIALVTELVRRAVRQPAAAVA